jgi:hypothetical protein
LRRRQRHEHSEEDTGRSAGVVGTSCPPVSRYADLFRSPRLTQQQRFDIPAVFPPHGAICSNDPINHTDPLGLSDDESWVQLRGKLEGLRQELARAGVSASDIVDVLTKIEADYARNRNARLELAKEVPDLEAALKVAEEKSQVYAMRNAIVVPFGASTDQPWVSVRPPFSSKEAVLEAYSGLQTKVASLRNALEAARAELNVADERRSELLRQSGVLHLTGEKVQAAKAVTAEQAKILLSQMEHARNRDYRVNKVDAVMEAAGLERKSLAAHVGVHMLDLAIGGPVGEAIGVAEMGCIAVEIAAGSWILVVY